VPRLLGSFLSRLAAAHGFPTRSRARRPGRGPLALAARQAARGAAIVALGLACSGASCRPAGRTTPSGVADARDLDRRPDDPGWQTAWDRLQQAHQTDPAGAEARALADELLAAADPPLSVRLAALRVRAEHAYLHGDDPVAQASATEGLTLGQGSADGEPHVLVDLARIRARALVRSGDPSSALAALSEPLVQGRGGLPPAEALGMRAVALDRMGDAAAAVAAFAAWREVLPEGQGTTLWAEQRLALLAEGLPGDALAQVVAAMPASPGRACLQARLGEPVPAGVPAWVAGCGTASGGIGILLPRSGPFSAFADEQLAATLAAIEVLGGDRAPALAWRDSGSTTKTAQAAARSLVGEGARVLVGPLGPKNVKAVLGEVDRQALVIVPGESTGSAAGVAPSLEQRVKALVERARARGCDRLVVLAPANAYGERAVAAAKAKGFPGEVVVRTYPPETTSFQPHVNPIMAALRGDAALLVPDTLARTEMIVRQLARAGRMPAHGDVPGLVVLSTAEGLSPQGLEQGRDVLEGVFVAPAAARGPASAEFEAAYARLQGEPPGDQGLLVFYAVQHAITGQPGPGAGRTTLTRVQGGRLVVEPTQTPAER
jgi:ABC-type branched-subunit amino acid transport system substrate-binding protein